jgi:hypothetical protein
MMCVGVICYCSCEVWNALSPIHEGAGIFFIQVGGLMQWLCALTPLLFIFPFLEALGGRVL